MCIITCVYIIKAFGVFGGFSFLQNIEKALETRCMDYKAEFGLRPLSVQYLSFERNRKKKKKEIYFCSVTKKKHPTFIVFDLDGVCLYSLAL